MSHLYFNKNLIILAVLLVVWIVRTLKNVIENVRDNFPSQSPRQARRAVPSQTTTEAERALLEALGNPLGTRPPAKAVPRTNVPPRPIIQIDPPRSFSAGGGATWRRAKQKTTPPPVTVAPPSANEPGVWIEAEKVVSEKKSTAPAITTSPTSSWREMLATPENLKRAIILREIFGPPKGLRSSSA